MFSPDLTSWRAQYERMQRAYSRVSESHESSIIYDDDLQHFFQDCWHLKDWIKYDSTLSLNNDDIEREVRAHECLRIVGDLANGSKHLRRTRPSPEAAYVTSKNVTVFIGQNRAADVSHVVTLIDGTTRSAQAVAKDACEAWNNVLHKFGLL